MFYGHETAVMHLTDTAVIRFEGYTVLLSCGNSEQSIEGDSKLQYNT
jgi:hypothetical protein